MGSTGTSLTQKQRQESVGHTSERQGTKNVRRICPEPPEEEDTKNGPRICPETPEREDTKNGRRICSAPPVREDTKNGRRIVPARPENGKKTPRLKERAPATIRDKRRSPEDRATLQQGSHAGLTPRPLRPKSPSLNHDPTNQEAEKIQLGVGVSATEARKVSTPAQQRTRRGKPGSPVRSRPAPSGKGRRTPS